MSLLIISLTLFIIIFHQILYWLWFWQLKEYRLDRARAAIFTIYDFRKLFFGQYDLRKWFRPKPTGRILLIFFLVFLELVFLYYLSIVDASSANGQLFNNTQNWYFMAVNELIKLLPPVVFPMFSLLLFPAVIIANLIFLLFCSFGVIAAVLISSIVVKPVKTFFVSRAKRKMKDFKGTVIGVTGSYGKTSTKELLAFVLSQKYKVAKTERNDNSEIGVAKTVLRLKGDEDFFVVEMGAYKIGEIKQICDTVKPKIGIITGLGDQHLALFGSLDNIRKAKYELIEALPRDNFGLIAGVDFTLNEAKNIQVFKESVEFDFETEHFSAPLIGKSLITNVLSVIKTARYLGFSLPEISEALENLDKNFSGAKLKVGINNCAMLDDSYNSSREAFLSAIEYLKDAWNSYQKIVVTPGMMELGNNARSDHLEIGEKLKFVDKIYVTSPNFYNELNVSGNAELVTNHKLLINKLMQVCNKKTIILFENRIPKIVIDRLIYV